MTTLPSMNLVLPTRSAPGSGLWADALDAALALVDAHDHTSGKGARVPTAGISINADLTFAGLWAPTNLARLSFTSVAALSSNNKSLFVGTDNELYWRSNAGTNVKLTSGSALNVAAFTGGIGGDYSSAGAALNFDDSNKRYTHKDGAANWARLASGDVRLFETGTAESVFVGLAAPAALAGSYTITMPLAAPGSTSLVQMDSSGVLTASNTTIGGTPNFTGAVTMASTLGVTSLITATAGITAAANQHATVSGTGRHKHGTMTMSIHASMFVPDSPDTVGGTGLIKFVTGVARGELTGNVSADPIFALAPIPLSVGHRILAVRVYVQDNVTGTTTMTANLRSMTSTGTDASVGSATSAGSGANQTLTIGSLSATIASGTSYYLRVTTSVSTADRGTFLYMAEVDYDLP